MKIKISFEPIFKFEDKKNKNLVTDSDRNYFNIQNKSQMNQFHNLIFKLISLKKKGYPIINSITYLTYLIKNNKKIVCRINESILSIDSSGYIYTCRIHKSRLHYVATNSNNLNLLENSWKKSQKFILNNICDCNCCSFFGYIETSLLLNYNLESFLNYKWI